MIRPIAATMLVLLASCGEKVKPREQSATEKKPAMQPGQIEIAANSPKLKQIRVEPVGTADVPLEEVTAPGKIETDPNRVSHVLLPLAGRILSVLVHVGDAVRQGQVLIQLEAPDADAAMSTYLQSQAGVNTARAAMLKARADYERTKDLFDHNAVAQKEVLNADSVVKQAESAVQQALAVQEQAQRRLELLGLKKDQFGQKVAVKAPLSGKVLEMNVAPGEYRNDTNAPLMTIADLSSVWVASDVPESAIRFIKPGERLDIELAAFPGETFHGRVTRLADTVDPQTRTVKVRAVMENPRGRFRPEMFGSIRHVESSRRMPVIPNAAVIQGDNRNFVFRELAAGKFEQVPVELGNRVGDNVGVTKGLNPGDRVVVDGVMLLKTT